ncbi:LysM domain-containing protein [Flavobacterium sp. LS1R49]|uniref:LysM domain-containing protein n=1 Tax=Flavobacterium shii TaxID=2987687 RepID=A0A9X2ZCR4_9FLAO|nr:LysM domain-containing protein [Flavobacterium shii]MCV9926940.1 LysM domain-containing protein [Flavobacterium shii]
MYYIDDESEVLSYDSHRTYKIRKGDTLQSVAQDFAVDARELRYYHNRYCNIPDLIEADFKSHLKLLILAPDKSDAKTEEKVAIPKKVIFGSVPFTIPFYPVNINNNYKVKYTFESDNKIKKLEYDVSVKWLQADKNGICFFEIDRLSVLHIDGAVADTKVNGLAEDAASILYPLQVVVDQKGNWIDILNHAAIAARWEDKKPEILEYYEGKAVLEYIDAIDYTLRDEDSLLESLSDDWFLKVFFNGVHTCYGSELVLEKDTYFSIMPKKATVKADIEQKVEEYLDDANLIMIKQKGELSEEDIKDDLFINSEVVGNYSAKYLLNPNHYSIESITLECDIVLGIPKKVKIEINNLNEKKEVAIATRKSIFIAEEKKKDNFFKGLFSRF